MPGRDAMCQKANGEHSFLPLFAKAREILRRAANISPGLNPSPEQARMATWPRTTNTPPVLPVLRVLRVLLLNRRPPLPLLLGSSSATRPAIFSAASSPARKPISRHTAASANGCMPPERRRVERHGQPPSTIFSPRPAPPKISLLARPNSGAKPSGLPATFPETAGGCPERRARHEGPARHFPPPPFPSCPSCPSCPSFFSSPPAVRFRRLPPNNLQTPHER